MSDLQLTLFLALCCINIVVFRFIEEAQQHRDGFIAGTAITAIAALAVSFVF